MTDAPITAAELAEMRRVHARATESTYKSVKHHLEDQDKWERMSRREWPRLMAEIERLREMLRVVTDCLETARMIYITLSGTEGKSGDRIMRKYVAEARAYLAAAGERDAAPEA